MSKNKIKVKDSDFMNKLDRKQFNKKERRKSKTEIEQGSINTNVVRPMSASADGAAVGQRSGGTVAEGPDFIHCYIRRNIGCHCKDECGYDALMRGMSDEAQP